MSQSAQDETRTHTILRPLPPQSSVYTNFTTCACPEQDSNLHTSRHAHLKRTRLPIPPSGRACINTSRDSRQAARLRLRIVLRFFGLQNYVLHPEVVWTLFCLTAKKKSGKRDSNSRPRPWQGRALPTELFPQSFFNNLLKNTAFFQ